MMINYFQRVNISAAIVPMTQSTAGAPFYTWDTSDKSLILSSFSGAMWSPRCRQVSGCNLGRNLLVLTTCFTIL